MPDEAKAWMLARCFSSPPQRYSGPVIGFDVPALRKNRHSHRLSLCDRPTCKRLTSRPPQTHTFSLVEQRARSPEPYRREPTAIILSREKPIILLEDIVTGLDVSEKTIRDYRDAGKNQGLREWRGEIIKFVLQCDLDRFLENSFISSSHPDYKTVKKKSTNGGNAKHTTTKS